jgi:hypothetical protein
MKIESAFLCEEVDPLASAKLQVADLGISDVSSPDYPTPLRNPLVVIVVFEFLDLDDELRIEVGVRTGESTAVGYVIDLHSLALSVRPTAMPAWHVRLVPRDQLKIPSTGAHSIVFLHDGAELFCIPLWAN